MLIYKRAYFAGFLGYAAMLVLSVIFYKERTIFTDIAFQLFHIIRTGTFTIQNLRFGAAVTQVFPLLATKAGLSLGNVMLIYSLAFPAYYLACYVICGSILKRYDYALLLLGCNLLFVTDTFYWTQSELPQGIAFMIVWLSFVSSHFYNGRVLVRLFSFLAIVTMAFFHPLIIFPFFYVLGFLFLKALVPRRQLYTWAAFFLFVLIIKNTLLATTYDKHSMGGLRHILTLFPNYFDIYSTRQFLTNCITRFYWIPILFALNSGVYIYQKKWKLLFFSCAAVLGYLLLINVCYSTASTEELYIENLYLPLGIFIGLPFIIDVLPTLKSNAMGVLIVLAITITYFGRVYAHSSVYTNRLGWERKLLNEKKGEKLTIPQASVPLDTLIITWGTPYEFWLLSTTELHKTASIDIVDSTGQYEWMMGNNKAFITYGVMYPYRELPAKYFIFTDTVTNYTLLK